MPDSRHGRGTLLLLLAFVVVYLVWGSTFLAIRIALPSLPPLLLCGLRLAIAGAGMLAWSRLRGDRWWSAGATGPGVEWRNAAIVGVLLPAVGNGTVTFSVTHLPSGLAALCMGTIPLWMAFLGRFDSAAPPLPLRAWIGLVLGFAGIAWLIGPGVGTSGGVHVSPVWALLPVLGAFSWAWGSLWSRRVRMPTSALLSTAIGMSAGGIVLLVLSAWRGEWATFDAARVTPSAWAALAYLIVFGSILGFTAYLYLLRRIAPATVATYAFVNPVVAMALGWAFAGEALTPRTLSAAVVVVAAVVLITTAGPAAERSGIATAGAIARRP